MIGETKVFLDFFSVGRFELDAIAILILTNPRTQEHTNALISSSKT